MSATTNSDVEHKRFGLFWSYQWARKRQGAADVRRQNPVTYQQIRKYYKQLKRQDPDAAREFRRKHENQSRNAIVPYRALRETTKDHANTKALVRQARGKNQGSDIYMSFIDSDTKSFIYEGVGLYAAYSRLYDERHPPTVMSTGYESFYELMPMLALACTLDRRVRAATAKYVPLGVYCPEPNFVIQVLADQETITESFHEGTLKLGKIKTGYYVSPKEARLILKEVAKRQNIDRAHFLLFSSANPIIIHASKRSTQNKQHSDLHFDGKLNSDNKYTGWSKQDIINISSQASQSHVSPRDWATNMLSTFTLNNEVAINGGVIKDGFVIRNMAISLLSRLYGFYDPISLCARNLDQSDDDDIYRQKLHHILVNYHAIIGENQLKYGSRKAKQVELFVTARIVRNKNIKSEIDAAWLYVNGISNIDDLEIMLRSILQNADIVSIKNAAMASGEAIQQTLLEYLEFPTNSATLSASNS